MICSVLLWFVKRGDVAQRSIGYEGSYFREETVWLVVPSRRRDVGPRPMGVHCLTCGCVYVGDVWVWLMCREGSDVEKCVLVVAILDRRSISKSNFVVHMLMVGDVMFFLCLTLKIERYVKS